MRGKQQRTYKLDIFTPQGKQITILPPLSIQFSLTRNVLASANKANITVINLGAVTRNQVFKDRYSISEYWRVSLFAGYNNSLHEIFTGNMYEAFSVKQKTEWITKIDCFDGMDAIQNGFTASTFQKETPKENILSSIINDMPNMIKGIFGDNATGQASRGQTLVGQSSEVLANQTGGKYFIDNETINVLNDNEVLRGPVIVLDAEDLLETPKRRETFLDIKVLFEPQLQVGRVYEIQSLDPIYNGQYKIVGFSHDVTISGAESGTAYTNIQLYYGSQGLRTVPF